MSHNITATKRRIMPPTRMHDEAQTDTQLRAHETDSSGRHGKQSTHGCGCQPAWANPRQACRSTSRVPLAPGRAAIAQNE